MVLDFATHHEFELSYFKSWKKAVTFVAEKKPACLLTLHPIVC
jgi:hypothetical protein